MSLYSRVVDKIVTYKFRLPLYLLCREPLSRLLPDAFYLKCKYYMYFGKRLDLRQPKTFNQKMQWLKLNNRKPVFTKMADKIDAKEYVGQAIGYEYVVPMIAEWKKFEEIDFETLPNQFVLKTTHGCGGMVICKDKKTLDYSKARDILVKSAKGNYFYNGREWPYKNIVPRIFAEEFMQNKEDEVLNVFKIFNFSGKPFLIQVIQDDKTDHETIDYFDTNWKKLDLYQTFPNSKNSVEKPETLDLMLSLAEKLSAGFPFLRTDFYEVNGKVFFSEFTFYSDDGFAPFHPSSWDEKLGEKIDLSLVKY
ncbi:TupA-like ATPgrasp [Kandleria vitulina]|uniref:TupA-like ATPgrasp n=1 Tax=Kandleria vitulina TaxID=1630 RepID=A0A1H2VNM7_9FIRM|nr:TupA-like ATPgrasp [Kandleria vitulina]